jgi:hypothetical protein
VPHVELSITDFGTVTPPPSAEPQSSDLAPAEPPTEPAADPLAHWVRAVASAVEPCLVIDADAMIVAMSPSCVTLMRLEQSPVGESLNKGPLRLIDFGDGSKLGDTEVTKVPPILAVTSGRLARGLIRVRCDGAVCTFDAIATPIGPVGTVSGSLTFFSPV